MFKIHTGNKSSGVHWIQCSIYTDYAEKTCTQYSVEIEQVQQEDFTNKAIQRKMENMK